MFTSNPSLINLDGLQNIRYVGGGLTMQGLEGNYGRCGLLSEKYGVTHRAGRCRLTPGRPRLVPALEAQIC